MALMDNARERVRALEAAPPAEAPAQTLAARRKTPMLRRPGDRAPRVPQFRGDQQVPEWVVILAIALAVVVPAIMISRAWRPTPAPAPVQTLGAPREVVPTAAPRPTSAPTAAATVAPTAAPVGGGGFLEPIAPTAGPALPPVAGPPPAQAPIVVVYEPVHAPTPSDLIPIPPAQESIPVRVDIQYAQPPGATPWPTPYYGKLNGGGGSWDDQP